MKKIRRKASEESSTNIIAYVLVGAAVLSAVAVGWYKDSEEKQATRVDDQDTVEMRLFENKETCSAERPLLVTVTNNNPEKTVKEIDFTLEIFEQGKSDNRAQDSQRTWTVTTRPGEAKQECFAVPLPERGVSIQGPVVRLNKGHVTFYADDERIPP